MLDAVVAAYDDDAPRLVVADFLLEQGEPRGELIRVQCELARAEGARKAELDARELELFAAHRERWSSEVGFPTNQAIFRRGFATSFIAQASQLIQARDRVANARTVKMGLLFEQDAEPRKIGAVIRHLKLERLALRGESNAERARELFGHLRDLHLIDLAGASMSWVAALALTEGLGVKTVNLTRARPMSGTYLELLGAAPLPSLVKLAMPWCFLHGGFEGFAASKVFNQLTWLQLEGNPIGDRGAQAIARQKAPGLTYLGLSRCKIFPDGGAALAASPHLPRDLELDLRFNTLNQSIPALRERFPRVLV
jgi:uncharacterized protein (TIGR02996 family)